MSRQMNIEQIFERMVSIEIINFPICVKKQTKDTNKTKQNKKNDYLFCQKLWLRKGSTALNSPVH